MKEPMHSMDSVSLSTCIGEVRINLDESYI